MSNNAEQIPQAEVMPAPSISSDVVAQPRSGLPDNPSLWRVLLYKTGQGISKTGNAIEKSASKSSQAISESSQKMIDSVQQPQPAPVLSQPAAISETSAVPIEQGTLSSPTQP